MSKKSETDLAARARMEQAMARLASGEEVHVLCGVGQAYHVRKLSKVMIDDTREGEFFIASTIINNGRDKNPRHQGLQMTTARSMSGFYILTPSELETCKKMNKAGLRDIFRSLRAKLDPKPAADSRTNVKKTAPAGSDINELWTELVDLRKRLENTAKNSCTAHRAGKIESQLVNLTKIVHELTQKKETESSRPLPNGFRQSALPIVSGNGV